MPPTGIIVVHTIHRNLDSNCLLARPGHVIHRILYQYISIYASKISTRVPRTTASNCNGIV